MDELERLRAEWRVQCKTVIWTNGIFDLIHAGHVRSLRDAKSLGDLLIVGINSDASARAVKGAGRPLMPQEDRAEVLSALEMVDHVVIFDETEPTKPHSQQQPDIHCKGEEYADGN